jgi:hypothetical protein
VRGVEGPGNGPQIDRRVRIGGRGWKLRQQAGPGAAEAELSASLAPERVGGGRGGRGGGRGRRATVTSRVRGRGLCCGTPGVKKQG